MKKTLLVAGMSVLCGWASAQQKEAAEKVVEEGVVLHDKGEYDAAVAKYDAALQLDQDNLVALSEKAMSLFALKKYDESVQCCRKAIETHPYDPLLKSVYITCGSAYDAQGQSDKALVLYDEGLKQFPDSYLLYFNKGITYSGTKNYEEATACFQHAVSINPKHASSHNALARMLDIKNKKIPAIMAYGRFLVLEPDSKRAKEDADFMRNLVKGNVEKTGKKSITINIDPSTLGDTTADGKSKENNFGSTDLIMSLSGAMDLDKQNKKKKPVELFASNIETMCSSLSESRKDNFGFYWEYYAPYFIAMKEQNLVSTFAYIVFATSGEPDVEKWIKNHAEDIKTFYTWSAGYEWKRN